VLIEAAQGSAVAVASPYGKNIQTACGSVR
jgi:hypothetical protein